MLPVITKGTVKPEMTRGASCRSLAGLDYGFHLSIPLYEV